MVEVALVVVEFVTFNPTIVARVDVNASIEPDKARNAEAKNDVVVAAVPVAFVKLRPPTVPFVSVPFVAVRLVAVRFVAN